MSLFVAGVVIVLGIAMIVAGVDGTGVGLFTGITGKTPAATSSGSSSSKTPTSPTLPATPGVIQI